MRNIIESIEHGFVPASTANLFERTNRNLLFVYSGMACSERRHIVTFYRQTQLKPFACGPCKEHGWPFPSVGPIQGWVATGLILVSDQGGKSRVSGFPKSAIFSSFWTS